MKTEEIIVQTDDVKVRLIELPAAAATPFHHHSSITDTMFGIAGEILVTVKNPAQQICLTPGRHCTVKPGTIHRVANGLLKKSSTYLLVQGVGAYDFIPETDSK